MSLLSLLRRCSHTSSNGPDGLVSNHNLAPVIDLLADGHELSRVDSGSLTSLTLVKFLANTGHDVEVLVKRGLDLGCDDLVGLTEDVASLAVTENDPVEAEVLDHGGGRLASERSVAVKRTVLCGELHLGASKRLLGSTEVQEGRCNDNLNLVLVEAEGLQHVSGESAAEIYSSIAFPISSNK